MKYKFNSKFNLGYQLIPGYGSVNFVKKGHRDDIIVLDDSTISLIEKIQSLGSIEVDAESTSEDFNRLISEQILISIDQEKEEDLSLYTQSLNFWLQVTDTCNLACSYCYIPSLNSKRTFRSDLFDLLKKKLLTVKGLKTVHIKIAGGEPLLSFNEWQEGVIALRKALAENGIELQLRLISNLTILTEEMIQFIQTNGLAISVSLDGTAYFNDKNRIYTGTQKGTFSVVRKNLERLHAAGIKPSVMITVTSENQDGVPDLISFLVENDITFRIADAKGGYITADEFEAVMKKSVRVISDGVGDGFPVSSRIVVSDLRLLSANSTPCSMGKNGAAIYLDGSVYFCHTEFESGQPIGHLEEGVNLLNIIQRGRQKQFGLSDDCQSCEYRLICAGGCPLYRVDGKSPMCQSYKKIIKSVFSLYEQEKSNT